MLITIPPMAGQFFSGVMGNYSGWNAISGWGGGGTSTPPPSVGGGQSVSTQNVSYNRQEKESNDVRPHDYHGSRVYNSNQSNLPIDHVKTDSQFGHARSGETQLVQGMSNKIKPTKKETES